MKELGVVGVASLPIGGTYTMDINDAVSAAMAIKPKVVIPMHYLMADPREFKMKLETRIAIKAVPLQIGEIYRLL